MNQPPSDNQEPIISNIPRAWGIQVLLLFVMVSPQAFLGLVSETTDVSPVAVILVFLSGYAGWLVWTKNGYYKLTNFDNFFYVESKQQECGMLQRSCWHFTMGLMVLLVFMTISSLV